MDGVSSSSWNRDSMMRELALDFGVGGSARGLVLDLAGLDEALAGTSYALVGGVAVLLHSPGHRVTLDVDAAIREARATVGRRLQVVASRAPADVDHDWVLPQGAPVDVLPVMHRDPRPGTRDRAGRAKEIALRWAVGTADRVRISAPLPDRAEAELQLTTPAALIALKTISAVDPRRGPKRSTDLLDLWLLLAGDVASTTAEGMGGLEDAPSEVKDWVADVLRDFMERDPRRFLSDMAGSRWSPADADEVAAVYESLVKPTVNGWRRR